MSLRSLSLRNIDPVPPSDSNSFRIGLAHWQDGLLWGPAVGGHRRPGLFSLKKTWLVMSLSGAISPLEMAVCMTWSEQSNEASQRAPCTPWPQDTSWERGSSSLEAVMLPKTKSQKRMSEKKATGAEKSPQEASEAVWCIRPSFVPFKTEFICASALHDYIFHIAG